MLKHIFRILASGIAVILLIMLFRTFINTPDKKKKHTLVSVIADTSGFHHLSQAIQFKTVNHDELFKNELYKENERFQAWMLKTYPEIANNCTVQTIGNSLLICLKGETRQKPALFLAHLDVVPAEGQWRFRPFDGKILGDTLWGRGALDDKNTAIALLESLNIIIKRGKKPNRDIYLAFGHDEETGGHWGARQIADHFRSQNLQFEFIADEGFGVMEGIVPGLEKPCAIIGLAEKGDLTLKLSVKLDGGHSAWPSTENASSVLTGALSKIDAFQFEPIIEGPVKMLFEEAGRHMKFGYRFLFSNLWITQPLVKSQLLKAEKTAASIRTTHVTTFIHAGIKENVVPEKAEALVNFRLIPGNSIDLVKKTIEKVVSDSRVKISIDGKPIEASHVSPANGWSYTLICNTIKRIFPETVTVPGIVITGTDCKNYTGLSENIYRFVPFRFNEHNLKGIHGEDEYITLGQFSEGVAYYSALFSAL